MNVGNSRKSRLPLIIDLVNRHFISSQDELLKLLHARGMAVTQATLSRDLKLLKAMKVHDGEKGCRYVISEGYPSLADASSAEGWTGLHPEATSLGVSGNMMVIKTRNGYASPLAYDLDALGSSLILGTIAGGDTVLAVLSAHADFDSILKLLEGFLPENVLSDARNA